jgi:glycyl-tRNA synthetase
MNALYGRNGLIFWDQEAIVARRMMERQFVLKLEQNLRSQNGAFFFLQVEAPILTPKELVNPQYTEANIFTTADDLVLRPETTMGSYAAARHLLTHHTKTRLPFVVWQHGLSFRREQDQVTKNMRLKQFYQLEFQILFSPKTANDYSVSMVPAVRDMIAQMIGPCRIEPSDRVPNYAEWTQDVIHEASNMEVCSMSKRKDFDLASVLEVAIGTDRCVFHFTRNVEAGMKGE